MPDHKLSNADNFLGSCWSSLLGDDCSRGKDSSVVIDLVRNSCCNDKGDPVLSSIGSIFSLAKLLSSSGSLTTLVDVTCIASKTSAILNF